MEIPLDLGLSSLGEMLGLSPSPKGTKPKEEADNVNEPSGKAASPRKTFDIQEMLPPTPPQLKDLRKQIEQKLPLMVPNVGSPIQQTKSIPSASTSPTATPHNTVRFAVSTDETKEDELHQVWGWVENYQFMFQLIMGIVIILYGHFFPMTLLVVQGMLTTVNHCTPFYPTFISLLLISYSYHVRHKAMAITGGPKLRQSFADLYEHYLHAKQIFEDALPEFRLSQGIFPLYTSSYLNSSPTSCHCRFITSILV